MTYWQKEWAKYFGMFIVATLLIFVYLSAQVYIFKDKAEEFISCFPDTIWEMEDGTYQGTYKGLSHLARVRFEVENNKLVGFNLESIARTFMFHVSPEDFQTEIRAQKKLNFDAISGATYSSNFIKAAILEAAAAEPAVTDAVAAAPAALQRDIAVDLSNNGDGTGMRAEFPAEELIESDQFQLTNTSGAFKYLTVTGVYEDGGTDELYSGSGKDKEFKAIVSELTGNPGSYTKVVFTVNGDSEQFIKAPCRAQLSMGTVSVKEPSAANDFLSKLKSIIATGLLIIYPLYIFLLYKLAFILFRFTGRDRKSPDGALKLKNFRTMAFIVVLMVAGIFGLGYLGADERVSIVAYISTFLGILVLFRNGIRDVHKNRCPNCHHYGSNTTKVKHTGTTETTTKYVNVKTGATVRTEKSRSMKFDHEMRCPECGCVWHHGEST